MYIFKKDPYDWFCGSRPHMVQNILFQINPAFLKTFQLINQPSKKPSKKKALSWFQLNILINFDNS